MNYKSKYLLHGLNPDVEAHNEFLNWLTAVAILVELAVERGLAAGCWPDWEAPAYSK